MTIQINTESFKGLSGLSVTRLTDNTVYNWPTPSTFVISPNQTEKVNMGRNELGERVQVSSYKTGETPTLNISYEYFQPEMISFRTGNQLAAGTFDEVVPRLIQVSQEDVAADGATGLYFTVVEDAPESTGSVTRDSVSTKLTRQPYATFDNTTDDSYAVGASGALKFSANLVANKDVVTVLVPVPNVAGARISDLLVGPVAIRAKLVTSNNTLSLFSTEAAVIDLASANFDFSGEANSDMNFRLNSIPNRCRSYELTATSIKVTC